MAAPETPGSRDTTSSLRLHRWSDRAVIAIAITALASGFGQFGVVAALGDVSTQLGHVAAGGTIADKVGLSGTSLGIGLAIIRLASLGSLPLIGIADRLGRRRVILAVTILGLALTVVAAASPGYWWFVAIFVFGRPLLSATNALAEVMAAEETSSRDRAAAVALIAAGYGVGAGLSAIIHSLASGALGFRGIFALAILPLALVLFVRGWIEEPSRFMVAEAAADRPTPVLGAIGPRYRARVLVLAAIAFAISIITGPANSFLFLYAQDVVHQAGYVTALWWPRRASSGSSASCVAGGSPTGSADGRPAREQWSPSASQALWPTRGRGLRSWSGTSWACSVDHTSASCGIPLDGAVPDVCAGLGDRLVGHGGSPRRRWRTGRVRRRGRRGNRFAAAADITFLPVTGAAALFWLLPETKGREPESPVARGGTSVVGERDRVRRAARGGDGDLSGRRSGGGEGKVNEEVVRDRQLRRRQLPFDLPTIRPL